MMHTFPMGKGLRSCSFGMCSSFGLDGMLASSQEFHVVSLEGFSRSSPVTMS